MEAFCVSLGRNRDEFNRSVKTADMSAANRSMQVGSTRKDPL
jgi:hypothetical protein